jgi:vacuolar-type H+-ATPase catalytic subunit A/Vma1
MFKDFDNEKQADEFKKLQRTKGLAASRFDYGNNRYRVKVWELWSTHPERTQHALSDNAWKLSQDIQELNHVKDIINSQKFIDCDYESVIIVAKKLNKESWFQSPQDVIDFLDYPDKQLAKIKEMVDTALQEYDDEWNDKQGQME